MLKMGRFPALIRRPWHCDGPRGASLVLYCYFIAGGAIVMTVSFVAFHAVDSFGSDKLNKVHREAFDSSIN